MKTDMTAILYHPLLPGEITLWEMLRLTKMGDPVPDISLRLDFSFLSCFQSLALGVITPLPSFAHLPIVPTMVFHFPS